MAWAANADHLADELTGKLAFVPFIVMPRARDPMVPGQPLFPFTNRASPLHSERFH